VVTAQIIDYGRGPVSAGEWGANRSIRLRNDKTLSPNYSSRVLKTVPSPAIVPKQVSAGVGLAGQLWPLGAGEMRAMAPSRSGMPVRMRLEGALPPLDEVRSPAGRFAKQVRRLLPRPASVNPVFRPGAGRPPEQQTLN
jgi:hypothetical protein